MTQLLELNKIKRWLTPGPPVRVSSVEDESHEGIRAGRLTLRVVRPTDTAGLSQLIKKNSSHLFQWLPKPDAARSCRQVAEHWVRRAAEGESDGTACRRLAVLPSGTIVGGVNLIRIERGLDWQADLNWWVTAEQSGKGFGTEIVRGALAHAFADMPTGLGLHKVHAGIQPENTASERLAVKAGFRPDPALDSRLLVNGEWQLHRGYVARV